MFLIFFELLRCKIIPVKCEFASYAIVVIISVDACVLPKVVVICIDQFGCAKWTIHTASNYVRLDISNKQIR